MADTIKIQLSDMYELITSEQVSTAKNYVLRREQAARGLSSLVDALMEDAAEQITKICYRYGIDPMRFSLSPNYNSDMFKEIAEVLDVLEEEILDLTTSYATKCTKDEKKKALLLLWVLALGKNNQGLRQTLEKRLWVFSRDLEAMLVAVKSAGLDVTKAVTRIKSYLHAVYTMPEMKPLFRYSQKYKATYIRSRGVKYGNAGSSNSEANNIERFARVTVQMAWMHQLKDNYEEKGAAGYMCFRGSNWDCAACDEVCNVFHPIENGMVLPVHPSCACYAVPVYIRDVETLMQ